MSDELNSLSLAHSESLDKNKLTAFTKIALAWSHTLTYTHKNTLYELWQKMKFFLLFLLLSLLAATRAEKNKINAYCVIKIDLVFEISLFQFFCCWFCCWEMCTMIESENTYLNGNSRNKKMQELEANIELSIVANVWDLVRITLTQVNK